MLDLLPGERFYQQFSINIAWSEPAEVGKELSPWQTRDLPAGRMWNGIHPRKMFREPATLEDAELWAEEHGKEYLREYPEKNISDFSVRASYCQSEVWSITWFSHFTFDIGLSDVEVLESFWRFVIRMQERNRREGEFVDGHWREPYCLMGAEDRWRWRGGSDGQAPCRCEHCKKLGIVRIDH